MNKQDLIDTLAGEHGLTKAEARHYVDRFFDLMIETLARGERVEIRGLCAFKVKEYKPYAGRNPKTGETVAVKPKRLPFFKPGTELKERVDR